MKICVIGGGTAGWMAALFIAREQPGHTITVVESSKVGIIGTGEGSTGLFAEVIRNIFKIHFEEFMVNTGATQKMGIRFRNWRGDGRSYIAPLDNTETVSHQVDASLIHHCRHGAGAKQAHLSTLGGVLAASSRSSIRLNRGELVPVHSYHFDGHQVGQYFKRLTTQQGVEVIDAEYESCTRDERGNITTVRLTNGVTVAADVWVDATGFARVLGKVVDAGWHSYGDDFTCDRALPFHLPHDGQIDPLTEADALSAGWMWRIPLQARRGCGYVFDSHFLTPDQAQEEIEQTLGCKIDPIKVIKFDSGRVERTFSHNVVSLGLAGNFLEPLQATNIHGTIMQLSYMTEAWMRPHGIAGPHQSASLNECINQGFDYFADLIQIHYRSGRTDTEFWRHQQSIPPRPRLEYLKELCEHRWPNTRDWNVNFSGATYGVCIYPMLEYGWLDRAIALQPFKDPEAARMSYEREQQSLLSFQSEAMDNTELIRRLRTGRILQQTAAPMSANIKIQLPCPQI